MIKRRIRDSITTVMLAASIASCTPKLHLNYPTVPQILPSVGITFAEWCREDFGRHETEALSKLKRMGVKNAAIFVPIYQQKKSDFEIKALTKKCPPKEERTKGYIGTPSDDYLEQMIEEAHKNDIKVFFRLSLELHEGWRGEINPRDAKKWFNSYSEHITHYAKLAEKLTVEKFSIGTEMKSMEQYTDEWKKLIGQVRKTYHGELTYTANWNSFDKVLFWDKLDFASISAYFPLKSENDDVESIKKAWEPHLKHIQKFKQNLRKEIVFAEVGCRSIDGAIRQPWEYSNSGIIDLEEQSNYFKALFELFKSNTLPVEEAYIWISRYAKEDTPNLQGYNIFGKPAEKALEEYLRQ